MKKILFLMSAALVAMSLCAAPVDQVTALQKAKSYLTNELYAGKLMSPAALNPVLLKAEMGNVKLNQPVYYIYNTSTTFLVVAGDDRAEEILMVGDRPLKDINNLAPGLQDMLRQYKEEITYLQEHPGLQVDPIVSPQNTPSLRATNVGPLLTCNWDQEAPYYNQCRFTYNGTTYQCLTGCPATSASMVCYYWKYPTAATGTVPEYTDYLDISSSSYSTNYKSFTYSALPSTTFDWNNMLDNYGSSSSSYTTAQGTAVATLMRYVGQAEKMTYGRNGSGISVDDAQNVADMFIMFGYDSSTTRLVKEYQSMDNYGNQSGRIYTDAEWAAMIQEEMIAGRPIVFMAVSTSAGGHAFNVDGYQSSSNKYHINFGWSGDGNAWCSLNSFGYSGYNFSVYQQMIIGIQPPSGQTTTPVLTVNPTSLNFTGCSIGETYTKTFTVSGTDLRGEVSISSNSGTFTVSPSTLTASQAQAGATVTVTYKPTSSGTQNATITVSSSAAESKTVSVSGTATTTPKITVNPNSLSMSTTVGTPVTKTFTVTGTNLTGVVNLTCSGTGFSIDKTNITKTAASQGATVTVTYNPTTKGTHTGTVTLTSTGAEAVTVSLNGTAVGTPTLTVNPASLSFNATVGETVTKTFTVTGADLTGNVMLAVSGTGFSIDKTSITQSAATNGATVTVTYKPTTGGTHTGTVALSSNGAQQVTVALNGIATTVPTLSANPTTLDFVTTVGTPVTKAFVLNSANLEGNVTLAIQGEGFTIDKTNIIPGAANNAYVNVTYTPTAFGIHTGTVTITSPNAQTITVTLNGQADLVKFAPVMLPAVEDYINLTKFRADWTDETPAENVASYTLEVMAKSTEPEPVEGGVCDMTDIEAVTNESGSLPNCASTATDYLPDGWTAENYLYINDGFVITGATTSSSWWNPTTTYGAIVSPLLDLTGNNKVTVVARVKSYYPSYYGVGQVRISTNSAYQDYTLGSNDDDDFQTITVVLNCSSSDQVRVQGRANYIAIESVNIYAGDITEGAKFRAQESGDANYRLITGITDKFYTINDLTPEGIFAYRVKALYLDGVEGEWSNVEEVALFENTQFLLGDVNHDGQVTIKDVTDLIDYLLGSGNDIDTAAADVSGDGDVTIKDVTDLIDMLLGNQNVRLNKVNPFRLLVQ